MSNSVVFIQGQSPSHQRPLERFLPQIPLGIASTWLHKRLSHPNWVVDPFGASPQLGVEAAQEGYRVLVAANNPITRFLIEMFAEAITATEFRTALADLAISSKGEERMEPHIRSLYITECANCGQTLEAQAFIWERDNPNPIARIYHCPKCSDNGERPITQSDIERAARFSASGLHKARALERVTPIDDPDRGYVEDALGMYLPRTVYALFTLINKLDSFPLDRKRLLEALMLVTFDQTNVLWSYPVARSRPRQLSVPPRFLEKNVWLALEGAIETWTEWLKEGSKRESLVSRERAPFYIWPEQPPSTGGICLFEGPLRALADHLQQTPQDTIQPGAVLTVLPRPNQAFWTLSALWSGWLWGHHATERFRSVLRRRRYDWTWNAIALHAAFYHLVRILKPSTDCLGLIDEVEPGFLSSALLAAEIAGMNLYGLSMRAGSEKAQITWKGIAHKKDISEILTMSREDIITLSRQASLNYLRKRGEPSGYLQLHASALIELIQSHRLLSQPTNNPSTLLHNIDEALRDLFSFSGNYSRYDGSSHSLEIGYWWLDSVTERRISSETSIPLSDRVEIELVHYLHEHPDCMIEEIDQELCTLFKGLLTPEQELIEKCLRSYGELSSQEGKGWHLRLQDYPETRRADMETISKLIQQLGKRLNYQVERETKNSSDFLQNREFIIWKEANDSIAYSFHVQASAIFSEVVLSKEDSLSTTREDKSEQPPHNIIVIPGGRSHLVEYKIRHNPRLRSVLEEDWRFVKYRHLRRLSGNEELERMNLDTFLFQDPPSIRDPQLQLF